MILGIDIGTQSLKAVLTDHGLQVLAEAAEAYEPVFPRPGWAEQDPALWENALRSTVAQCLKSAGAEPGQVKAVGFGGQLDGCVAVDQGGRALGNAIIWMDRRATDQVAGLDEGEIRRITGGTLDAGHMAAKARWMLDSTQGKDIARFHQPVSYLVSRLTGRHVYDHGLASTTMVYSLARRDYDENLLARFGLRRDQLPQIAEAWEPAGKITADGAALCGLSAGIPVAVSTGDDYSTPLGAGLVEPGRFVCILGTAEVVGALDTSPKIDSAGLVETHSYFGRTYFIENPGWLSGGALEWFVRTHGLADVKELDLLAAAKPPGADGVLFIPALSGAMAPEWIESASGVFFGLTAAHTTGHLARAVLEGLAFAMRDVLDRLREMDVPVESILLLGGGAKSDIWAQIRADISGLAVHIADRVDTSPLGGAMLAAVAGGLQPDLAACAALVRDTGRVVEPSLRNTEIYESAYSQYRRLFKALRPMFLSQDRCGRI